MPKLIVTRGLPASGKTTWALKWLREDPVNRVRVNRDEIRKMGFSNFYSGTDTEPLTVKFRDRLIDEALASGKDVVNDDTNLSAKQLKPLMRIAQTLGAEFEVVDLSNVPLEECTSRNWARKLAGERGVPDGVIEGMHRKFVKGRQYPLDVPKTVHTDGCLYEPYTPDINLPLAVIFDIDGTVAHMNGRSPYDYSKVLTDLPDRAVIETAHLYDKAGYQVIFLSGRKYECFNDTMEWLCTYVDIGFQLLMRPDGDDRRDAIVKYELFDKYLRSEYNVVSVYDDRNQVVDMWRKLGLKTYQVEEGNF
jgi:predicted kinase